MWICLLLPFFLTRLFFLFSISLFSLSIFFRRETALYVDRATFLLIEQTSHRQKRKLFTELLTRIITLFPLNMRGNNYYFRRQYTYPISEEKIHFLPNVRLLLSKSEVTEKYKRDIARHIVQESSQHIFVIIFFSFFPFFSSATETTTIKRSRRSMPLHPTDSSLIDLIRLINRLIGEESVGCHLTLGTILPSFRLFSPRFNHGRSFLSLSINRYHHFVTFII